MAPSGTAPRKTRIQAQNEELILDAALEVFAAYGFRGSTVDQIATRCGMSTQWSQLRISPVAHSCS